jgi:hypothetical protein
MPLHRFARWPSRAAGALAAMACILLVTAVAAEARPADNGPATLSGTHRATPPTVVKETIVQPADRPDAILIVLLATGAVAAGYLGARVALRPSRVRPEQGR